MVVAGMEFAPGALVRVRGREWVVQNESTPHCLRLRPLGGSQEDVVTLLPALESTALQPATFPWPSPAQAGNHDAAVLLRDALQLKLRTGCGPFRCFGNIAVEPRAYQLVPLMMALRLPTVRLLIADDVGIGKTIEAGLIVRELYDRGEIQRVAVLCPPHLVEQWQRELLTRFHLNAAALTSGNVARLERDLPHGTSLFDQYPFVVVSLDYIKSERHREHFLSIAPECVVVDEAHTCTIGSQHKQLRFELLKRLVQKPHRHLLLLTATPHSGDDTAFYNLLSLIKPEFASLAQSEEAGRKALREELARHFVQRRRKDIEEWREHHSFPQRLTTEITYTLTGLWGQFFDDVQTYCVELAHRTEQQSAQTSRLIWYATLALLRCVSSSPAAAQQALTTRLSNTQSDASVQAADVTLEDARILDHLDDDHSINDLEPAGQIEEIRYLQTLIQTAASLRGMSGDPKLAALFRHLDPLLQQHFHPVIFCRYIATAHYVAEHLTLYCKQHFPKATVVTVTGEYSPQEREERVLGLGQEEFRILVATDCLSEGVNLQQSFNAVIHYDLAWNPTRHEQREGRVDRFGQQSPEVRCTMLYGQDNPIDGFILQVILKKARIIREELGIAVPIPEDETRINQAMIKAALLKRKPSNGSQMQFDFGVLAEDLKPIEAQWQDAIEKTKANRTVFAQRRLKPEDVFPEWHKQLALLGGSTDVQRFVKHACLRLGSPLEPRPHETWRFSPQALPQTLRERLRADGMSQPLLVDFSNPPQPNTVLIHRSHPLVSLLADALLEQSLDSAHTSNEYTGSLRLLAARCAATVTGDVSRMTTLYLLRLRHQIEQKFSGGSSHTIMAEETMTLAVRGRSQPEWLVGREADALLNMTPSGNLEQATIQHHIEHALQFLQNHLYKLDDLAQERAQMLLDDHRRFRDAADTTGRYFVRPCLPVDVMGVYVLLPDSM